MTRQHGTYQVTGRRPYRGHPPGDVFDALLDPAAEQRAVARHDIKLIARTVPSVQPGSFAFPQGWLDPPGRSVATARPTRGPSRGLSDSRRK